MRFAAILAAVLALVPPATAGASTVVVLPFENLSGVPAARTAMTEAILQRVEDLGYKVAAGAPVDEFLTSERLRYLDSLPTPERKKLLEKFQADAVVLGTIYSFMDGDNAIVAVAARMQRADASLVWFGVGGLSAQDTKGLFELGRVSTIRALADKVVSKLLRGFPGPGESGSPSGAKAKPIDIPGPRTYRSAALPAEGPILVCILPLANTSLSRVGPRVVGELLVQRLGTSKQFRVVEPADFRQALAAEGIRVIRLGDPVDLQRLSKRLGTRYFLQGTIYAYVEGSPRNASVPPVFELQLQLIDSSSGKVMWTSSLARKGTDYQGLFELGAISNVVTLADQVVAEMVAAFDHTEGAGRRGVSAAVAGSDKTYDGSDAATVTSCTLTGALKGDAANLQCSAARATFSDPKAGAGKTVTAVGLRLTGSAANRYVLDSDTATTTAAIRPKLVTASVAASDKTYDGEPAATISSCSLSGVLPADSSAVNCLAANATFSDPNAGSGKTVTAGAIALSGEASSNYVPSSPTATTTATIRRKPVTAEVTVSSKTYDGTAAATIAACSFPGVLAADKAGVVCKIGAAAFADAGAGSDKPVAVTGIGLSGQASANYVLRETTAAATAHITPRQVEVSIAAVDKDYDGTAAAQIAGCRLAGVIEGDSGKVGCEASSGAFSDKNAGAAKPVTASVALAGAAAGNYAISSPQATTTASITPKHVTGSFTVADKRYDGSPWVTVRTRSLSGVVPREAVRLSGGRARFADASVGVGKTVTLEGAKLTGPDSGNYVLDTVAPTTADITASRREPQ